MTTRLAHAAIVLAGLLLFAHGDLSNAETVVVGERRPSDPPPPPLPPCPPVPPGIDDAPLGCLTTPELRELYLKNEGHEHRGLLFNHLVGRVFEHDANELPSVNSPQAVEEILGAPDFIHKSTDEIGGEITKYGYLFSYKKEKDWVIIVVFKNGIFDSSRAATFDEMFKTRWNIK